MSEPSPKAKDNFYKELPKVELHRHLEGSLRVKTMMEIVRSHNLDVKDTGYLRPLVQVEGDMDYTFENFLAKFGTLRLFYKSPEIIKRITKEAIEDAAVDNVWYMELRFTPVALSQAEAFPINEVIDWVIEGVQEMEGETDVQVRLIVSVNRHEKVSVAEEVIQGAVDRQQDGIVGIDLAGNEAEYAAEPFQKLFAEAQREGMKITIHAGEWGGPDNVREAVQVLGADRIGHGIRVLEDPNVVRLAEERKIPFEVCVTSNHHSGVIEDIENHPLSEMIIKGLNVTINTDDPSISRITLGHEYKTVMETLGLPVWVLRERVLAAVRASFLPLRRRQQLAYQITEAFSHVMMNYE
jgi:adenosine deaminase